MRIGFFNIRYPKGIGILCEDFARLIESKGHEVYFLTYPLSRRRPALISDEWARDNVTIIETFERNAVKVDDATVRGWIEDNQLDVVFTAEQPNNLNVFPIAKKLGVSTINYIDIEMFDPTIEQYKDCDIFFCPTQQGYNILKGYEFHNLMSLKYHANANQYPWSLRKAEDKVEFVIHAGWGGQNGRKGVGPTIRAFAKATIRASVKVNPSNATLTIITQKKWRTYEEEFKKIVSEYSNILIKEVNDTQNVYNSAAYEEGHVVIQPSMWEGLGLTYIEAMMSGIPVISCDGPPMNEFITHGQTGLLVPCKEIAGSAIKKGLRVPAFIVDEDRLAEAIMQFADNPKLVEQMSHNTKQVWDGYQGYCQGFEEMFVRIGKPL